MRGFVLLLIWMAACSTPRPQNSGSSVTLEVRPDRAAPGDSVTLVLINRSEDVTGYNLCPSTLNLEAADGLVPIPSDRVCTMELRSLAPSQEDDFTLQLPDDLVPGSYLFETRVHDLDSGAQEILLSNPLTVVGGP